MTNRFTCIALFQPGKGYYHLYHLLDSTDNESETSRKVEFLP